MNDMRAPVAAFDASWWASVAAAPHAHDLFMLLRRLDARGEQPPLGRALRPVYEPLRLGQEPSMAFAPSNLAQVDLDHGPAPQVSVYGFGLFGPNGPLPLHLTEYARERKRHHGDRTLSAFADLFHHRLILLFYRAWADAQSVNSLDRPDRQRFVDYVASLVHMGQPTLKGRDHLSDHARHFMAGHLVRQTRNPEGLVQILRTNFGVPARIVEFVGQWVRLGAHQISRIGRAGRHHGLGQGAMVGVAVRDVQSKFRIELGPLSLEAFRSFLPGSPRLAQLTDWVRQYIGIELAWDLRLVLRRNDVHGVCLGRQTPLGLGSWLGQRMADTDAGELVLDPEARMARTRQPQSATP